MSWIIPAVLVALVAANAACWLRLEQTRVILNHTMEATIMLQRNAMNRAVVEELSPDVIERNGMNYPRAVECDRKLRECAHSWLQQGGDASAHLAACKAQQAICDPCFPPWDACTDGCLAAGDDMQVRKSCWQVCADKRLECARALPPPTP